MSSSRSSPSVAPKFLVQCGIFLVASLAVLYALLFVYNTLTRVRAFSPDSMNYVDVARNISLGRRLVQSAAGYNDARFLAVERIPEPVTSQPPLYPMVIAALGRVGIPLADAAILGSAGALALVILLSVALALRLFGAPAAWLACGLLSLYAPLQFTSRIAWSDTLGVVFVLGVLLALVRPATGRSRFIVAGLLCSAAFATRYALLPLVALPLVEAWRTSNERRRRADHIVSTLAAFSPGFLSIVCRNYYLTGHITGAPRNESLLGLGQVFVDVFSELFGNLNGLASLNVESTIFGVAVLVMALVLQRRSDGKEVARSFVTHGALGLLWIALYAAFIIFQRSRVHFDDIGPRLMLPAGVVVVILTAGWAALSLRVNRVAALGLSFVMLVAACNRELALFSHAPDGGEEARIAASGRLTWLAKNTSARDLLIAEDGADVAFLLQRPGLASFSPHPYTAYASYERLIAFSDRLAGGGVRAHVLCDSDAKRVRSQLVVSARTIRDRLGIRQNRRISANEVRCKTMGWSRLSSRVSRT